MPTPHPEEIDAAVVAYVTSYCGFCRAAERLLDDLGIEYVAVDVTRDFEARRWLEDRTGQSTVPQIFIRGESVGGYTDIAALHRRGELRPKVDGA
ncbi:MAG: glutaredoxin [Nannocystaceae bacterium]